jgi:hypothetical protein
MGHPISSSPDLIWLFRIPAEYGCPTHSRFSNEWDPPNHSGEYVPSQTAQASAD